MNAQQTFTEETCRFTLEPVDTERLAKLCGQFNQHLKQIEERLGVNIKNLGNIFIVTGSHKQAHSTKEVLHQLYRKTEMEEELTTNTIHLFLLESSIELIEVSTPKIDKPIIIRTKKRSITPRGYNQQIYVKSILRHDINFGIGPAGTGKTYLAVACAVQALLQEQVSRIILVRPVVEAGEKLGFLPGNLVQKIDPYLRPLYDALYEMLGFEYVEKLMNKNVIDVAPLAYMRGRTLNNAFIILDESQNTTPEQMKMFLTRIGFDSTAVITGDITQVDLPKGTPSGLVNSSNVLKDVDGIGFSWFTAKDVVRHPLVQRIIKAYHCYEIHGGK